MGTFEGYLGDFLREWRGVEGSGVRRK